MRNVLIAAWAGGGAWGMILATLHMGAHVAAHSGCAGAPLSGLFVLPAGLAGAVAGALLGGLLFPR